jgi:hypothetical protein
VRIFRKPGDPEIRYSQVKVRAFDETGSEVPLAQAKPEEEFFSGPTQSAGRFVASLKEGQRIVSVEVSRDGEKRTFEALSEKKAQSKNP